MFGGMHRLHELSDKEKLYKRLVNSLYGHECSIEDVEINHEAGFDPILSCKVSMPYKNYTDTDDAVDAFTYAYHDWKSIDELWPKIYIGRGNGKSVTQYRKWAKMFEPKIEKVHFSGPVTVVLWNDGTKTMVRCNEENFDHEKGLAMAIAKKMLGTNETGSNYYDEFKKWLPKEEKEETDAVTLYADGDPIKTIYKSISDTISDVFKIPKEKLEE